MPEFLEFRNTPRENGLSPVQMVFVHQLRSIIPAHRSAYAPCWKSVMDARDRQAAAYADSKSSYDLRSRGLAPLSIGVQCVQDPHSTIWNHLGVVVAIGRYRAYRVQFASGSVLWRNWRFLRRLVDPDVSKGGNEGIPNQRSTMEATGTTASPMPRNSRVTTKRVH